MSKFSLIGIVILSIFLIELSSDAIITNYGHNSPYKLVNSFKFDTENPYNQDLTRVEQFLFNQTYKNENNAERLNRIEYQVFKKNFPTLNISQRMNNVLAIIEEIIWEADILLQIRVITPHQVFEIE